MADPHVELRGITKRFGTNAPAVDNVSLTVPRGSFTTLLGPSGCGKTTLLRLIAGLYDAESGDIMVSGNRVNDLPPHQRRTAMVFQDYALFPHMTVFENVAYGLKLGKVSKADIVKRVGETLSFLGLAEYKERSPSRLSGGQQQRVALARALVIQPEVLLLDEPLSNLDAKLRVRIREELIQVQRQLGVTTIYVTHDQDEALAMSDWVAVMNKGVVVQWGPPDAIYYQPRTPFVADFVGVVNLVRAPVVRVTDGAPTVRLGDHEMTVGSTSAELAEGDEALLSIRPESLLITSPEGGGDTLGHLRDLAADATPFVDLLKAAVQSRHVSSIVPGVGRLARQIPLPGNVVSRTFLGHLMRYTVRIGAQDWLIDQPDPGAGAALEGRVTVLVDPARVHVVADRD